MNHPRSSAHNNASPRTGASAGKNPTGSQGQSQGTTNPAGTTTRGGTNTTMNTKTSDQRTDTALPTTIRRAGWYGLAEGVLGIIAALVMIIDAATGRGDDQSEIGGVWASWGNGYGTALWFIVIFGGVGVAGWGLTRGKRWGRAPVAMLNMLLLPVAWYMYSSARLELAIPTVMIAIVGLALLFNPSAVNWAASKYGD